MFHHAVGGRDEGDFARPNRDGLLVFNGMSRSTIESPSAGGAQSAVSVDVLAIRFDREIRQVAVAVAPRGWDPFAGELALPGVLLTAGERLLSAAERAVTGKLGLRPQDVLAAGQLSTFDEPNRDPRGPTLSLALWTVIEGEAPTVEGTRWVGLNDVPPLAFDHNRIITDCRPLLGARLWRDPVFTRALTGSRFPVGEAVEIQGSLDGRPPDRGNLNRLLHGIKGLRRTGDRQLVHGTGRPSTVWEWVPD